MLKLLEDKIVIENGYFVVPVNEKGVVAGSERMLALGGGIKARIAKSNDGKSVVESFLFDQDRFSTDAVNEWLDKNSKSFLQSLQKVQENAPRGSFQDITMRLSQAICSSDIFGPGHYSYVCYVFPDYCIVSCADIYYKVAYSENDKGEIALTAPEKVEMEFVTHEAKKLNEKLEKKSRPNCALSDEKFAIKVFENRSDKTKQEVVVVLIEAGTNYNKRRYYPKSTIREAAPLFAGLKMYLDHPTEQEEEDRPERSVKEWMSTIVESWYEDGKALGRVKVHNKEFWDLLESDDVYRENVAVSINSSGRRSFGTIDGLQMEIIEEISKPKSVDWVTEPGARGRVLALIESNRIKEEQKNMFKTITLKEFKTERPDLVQQIETEIRESLRAQLETEKQTAIEIATAPLKKEISDFKVKEQKGAQAGKIREQVEASKLPAQAKEKLIESLSAAVYESEDKLKEAVKAAIDAELKYLTEVGGVKIGVQEGDKNITESVTSDLEEAVGIKKEEKK